MAEVAFPPRLSRRMCIALAGRYDIEAALATTVEDRQIRPAEARLGDPLRETSGSVLNPASGSDNGFAVRRVQDLDLAARIQQARATFLNGGQNLRLPTRMEDFV